MIVGYDEWSEELQENPPIVVCYGTPRAEVKRLAREGKMPVLETDVAGAAAMRDAGLDAVYVFFAHPEEDEAAHRVNLVEAGEAEDLIPERLEEAAAELGQFVESQLPCAEVTLAQNTLSITYGALEGNCTYQGHTYSGTHAITVSSMGTLPARSPTPRTVDWITSTPSESAMIVLATPIPKSMWK